MTGVVVVGTGFGCITHVRALRAAGFTIVALVGRDPHKTGERAAAFGIPHATVSLEHALRLEGTDAVSIATPPHTHGELSAIAIDAGRHVLCEKPFMRDAAEAQEIYDMAVKAGVVHVLGTEFRFDAGQATLAHVIESGAIGEPRLATILLHVPALVDAAAVMPEWWTEPDRGGGWLGAHGSQVIDQVRATLGEFESVAGSLLCLGGALTAVDDTFVVDFRLRCGVVGVLQSTAGDRGPMLIETRVAGTDGTAWIDGLSERVFIADCAGQRRAEPIPLGAVPDVPPLPDGLVTTTYEQMTAHGLDLPAYTRLTRAFRDLIEGRTILDRPRMPTFADGVAQMRVLDAIRESARIGDVVKVQG